MQIKIVIIFFIILIFHRNFSDALEIDSKLDNSFYISRYIYKKADYSLCLLTDLDIRNTESNIDFSYENHFIRTGRIKRLGLWSELNNPLGITANSTVFNETVGFDTNNSFYKGGLYGISLEMDEGTGLSLLFPDNLWFGGNYTLITDHFLLTGFISTSAYSKISSDEWTDMYSVVPDTNPIHIGLQSILNLNNFTFNYMGTLSGSNTYKAGSYNRLFINFSGNNLHIKSFAGIVSPCFLSTDVKLSDKKYLLSLWAGLGFFSNYQTIFRAEYHEEHESVLHSAFIPSAGSSSIQLKYDNSKLLFSSELGQKFSFDNEGHEEVENMINGKFGVCHPFLISFSYGISFNFETIIERKYEFNIKGNMKNTDIKLVFKYIEEIFQPIDENVLRLRVDQKFDNGSFYLKIELRNEWEIDGLTIGFSTVI